MISPRKRLRMALEVLLVRMGLVIVPRLPRLVVIGLARCAGATAWITAAPYRRIGMANLDLAYGSDLSLAAKRRILRRSFQTFAIVVLDILWFTRHPRERLNRFIRFDAFGRHVLSQTPLICVTAHLGNWETLGQGVANAGYPLCSVAAPLRNPAVDRFFVPSRELTGQKILPHEGVMRSLLRVLRNNGRFAILLDQNTKPSEGGMFVPFFGLPVPISASASMLALRTRCNIGFGFALPQFDGTYQVDITRLLTRDEIEELCGDGPDGVAVLNAEIARTLEQAVRSYPENWLWMYKRWKHIAPGVARHRYPFYSKDLPPAEVRKMEPEAQGPRPPEAPDPPPPHLNPLPGGVRKQHGD